ncbi:MAG: Stealth CR1 domain-containing protein, partial [Mycoplasmataceae bacterium]|nr:Stealth CR1 domain-containing protein [Mycoplasmataceae bacterium]
MEKIDLVYLWVDGSDKKYIQRNKKWLKNVGGERLNNIDELKYSLRSVEKYLNWVNNIFIVTTQQIPTWLNQKNKRIKIIDHKEILPHNVKACFNAFALEINLYKIKELSEIF